MIVGHHANLYSERFVLMTLPNETVGADVYPVPPFVMVIDTTAFFCIVATAIADILDI